MNLYSQWGCLPRTRDGLFGSKCPSEARDKEALGAPSTSPSESLPLHTEVRLTDGLLEAASRSCVAARRARSECVIRSACSNIAQESAPSSESDESD